MHTRLTRSTVLAFLAAGSLLFAACSSGDGDSGTSDTAAETVTQDVTDTTMDVQEQLDQAEQADDALGQGNCAEAATAFGTVAASAAQALSNPDAFSIDDMKKNIEIARSAIPAELEDEFDLYAEMYIAYGEVIADVGGIQGLADPTNAAKLEELEEKINNDEITAAGETLTDYFANECTFLGEG